MGKDIYKPTIKFEVNSDSMDDNSIKSIIKGDVLEVKQVKKDFKKLEIMKDYYLVVTREIVALRQIKEINQQEGYITLTARNKSYEDIQLKINKVKTIYKVVSYSRATKFDFY